MFRVVIKSSCQHVNLRRTLVRPAVFSTSSSPSHDGETMTSLTGDGIFTVTMNRPKTLNAWTEPMMNQLNSHFERAGRDDDVKVVILTGEGKYYCAGVNLSGILKPMHPKRLHEMIKNKNQQLFNMFLDLKKPIIAAVNGPAVGASVTSAALCDAIVCSSTATFSTPFARLGVPPEGCSSVHFPRIFGQENANRMMGSEAWIPTAKEAKELGLVHSIVEVGGDGNENSAVLQASQDLAREWIRAGKPREIGPLRGGPEMAEEFKKSMQ